MFRYWKRKILALLRAILNADLDRKLTDSLMLLGKLHSDRITEKKNINSLCEVEFKVFSQSGEDGIIQFLTQRIPIPHRFFVEFGVENYVESNTRFLLQQNNWSGLIMDSSPSHIKSIKKMDLFWEKELSAICNFISPENINGIFEKEGLQIDGNDYWVWQAIHTIQPRIVICEYNSLFGATHAITVPYRSDFDRSKAHYSWLYFGSSLPALVELGNKKGYDFVGSNTMGHNAFFVRKDLSSPFRVLTAEEGYVCSKFRESRGPQGELTFVQGTDRVKLIEDIPVLDIHQNKLVPLKERL